MILIGLTTYMLSENWDIFRKNQYRQSGQVFEDRQKPQLHLYSTWDLNQTYF